MVCLSPTVWSRELNPCVCGSLQTAIALCVLFSGGTFLYAACMHILPEIMGDGPLSWGRLAWLLAGASLPVLFSVGHTH